MTTRPSTAALAEVRLMIERFSAIEPDLADLPAAIEALPSSPPLPEGLRLAWRGLYLSIEVPPRCILLVGCLDHAPDLTALCDTAGLLVVETDTVTPSVGLALPRPIPWRSLAEFAVGTLSDQDRDRCIASLVNSLQPAAVIVSGSRAGWSAMARDGAALRHRTALFATMAGPELVERYFRTCAPFLSALYGPDPVALQRLAHQFGLPPDEARKLKTTNDFAADLASLRAGTK